MENYCLPLVGQSLTAAVRTKKRDDQRDHTPELSGSERRCLQDRLDAQCPVTARDTVKWSLIWLGGLLLLALLAAGLIALRPGAILGGIAGGVLFVAGIICLYAFIMVVSGFFRWRKTYRQFAKDTIPTVRRVLQEGRCQSRDVTASEVYEIEEFEDEGPGYIFALGEGKSLLLKGQKYAPEEDKMPWPAGTFSLVRSTDGGLWIGLFSSARCCCRRRRFQMQECKEEFVWSEREDVLDGQPDQVLKGITKSGQQAPATLRR